jgi:hypothetical protein
MGEACMSEPFSLLTLSLLVRTVFSHCDDTFSGLLRLARAGRGHIDSFFVHSGHSKAPPCLRNTARNALPVDNLR